MVRSKIKDVNNGPDEKLRGTPVAYLTLAWDYDYASFHEEHAAIAKFAA